MQTHIKAREQPSSGSSVLQSVIDWGKNTFKNVTGTFSGQNQRDLQELQRQAAEVQYGRETASAREAMDFSAAEAQKNRDWQENMSNTAHQREMADLSAAGLNPILAAQGGAPMGGGAVGQGFSANAQQANVSTENQMIGMLQAVSGIINSAAKLAAVGA